MKAFKKKSSLHEQNFSSDTMLLNKLTQLFWAMLIVSIAVMPKLSNILLLCLLIISYPSYKNYHSTLSGLKQPAFILLVLTIFFWTCQGFISGNISETKYGLYPLLLVIPTLAFFSAELKSLQLGFIIAGYLAAIRAFGGWLYFHFQNNSIDLFEGENINQMLGMERPYLGFLLLIAGICCLWIWREKNKIIYLASFLFFLGTTAFFSARISFITFLLVAALFIWQTWKLSLIKKTTLVLSVVSLLLFIMSQNENLKKRLFLNSSIEQSIANFKHHEPRVIIWACAYQIAKSSDFALFWGIPSEQEIDEKLSACYSTMENQHRANYFKSEKLNVHSQFIAVYLTSGIIGLFLWLMFWSFLFLKSKNDILHICLGLSLLLFCIFEVLLRRQIGSYLFALTITLILISIATINAPSKQN